MNRHVLASIFASALIFLPAAATAHADELVTNGNFQTGDFTGWTTNNPPTPAIPFTWEIGLNGSNYYATTHCQGPDCIEGIAFQENYLQQTLNVVAGQVYDITFDYSPDIINSPATTPNELQLFFGSTEVTDLKNLTDASIVSYSFDVVAPSDTLFLMFLGEQTFSYDYLDNVSVSTVATPEPETLAMVGTGVLGLLGLARRRFVA
jgi:PEP-CTERM motif